MTTNKNGSGVLVQSRLGWTRIRAALALTIVVAWGLVKIASAQVTGQIVQQFYVPFPEADFKTSLQAIAARQHGQQPNHDHHLHRGGDEQYHHRL